MKRYGIFLLVILLATNGFILADQWEGKEDNRTPENEVAENNEETNGENTEQENQIYDTGEDWVDISNELSEISEDILKGEINGRTVLAYQGIDDHLFVDGEFTKVDMTVQDDRTGHKLNIEEFEKIFGLEYKGVDEFASVEEPQEAFCQTDVSETEVLKLLENISQPINYATFPTNPGQHPGAPREYRNGVHEGIDWFSGAIGREVTKDTEIFPMFEGKVVRIDHDYREMSRAEREGLLLDAQRIGYTPQSILEKMRGRQVWVENEDNVLVRYAHLNSVNKDLEVGDEVGLHTALGRAGNSGADQASSNPDNDVHLHSDILVCGLNFWEYGDTVSMVEALSELYMKNLNENPDIREETTRTEEEIKEDITTSEGFFEGWLDDESIYINWGKEGKIRFYLTEDVVNDMHKNDVRKGERVAFKYYVKEETLYIAEIKSMEY